MNTPWNIWLRPGEHGLESMRVHDIIASNQGEMLLALAKAGFGILRTAEYAISHELKDGSLVDLFPESACLAEEPIYIVFRAQTHLSARSRAFIDFMVDAYRNGEPWRDR